MSKRELAISGGNTKIGSIPNINLPPIVSCRPDAPCAQEGCYALKATKRFKHVRDMRMANWDFWNEDPKGYFAEIQNYLDEHQPRYFRFHSDGDIPDKNYFKRMCKLAKNNPHTRFLAFTKNYELDLNPAPPNLSIVWSAWPGLNMPNRNGHRIAWMQDKGGREKRILQVHFECHGHCQGCYACWHLKEIGRDVVLPKH